MARKLRMCATRGCPIWFFASETGRCRSCGELGLPFTPRLWKRRNGKPDG